MGKFNVDTLKGKGKTKTDKELEIDGKVRDHNRDQSMKDFLYLMIKIIIVLAIVGVGCYLFFLANTKGMEDMFDFAAKIGTFVGTYIMGIFTKNKILDKNSL